MFLLCSGTSLQFYNDVEVVQSPCYALRLHSHLKGFVMHYKYCFFGISEFLSTIVSPTANITFCCGRHPEAAVSPTDYPALSLAPSNWKNNWWAFRFQRWCQPQRFCKAQPHSKTGHLPQESTAWRKHSHRILRQLLSVAEVGWPNNHFEGAVLSPVPPLAPKIREIGE